MKVKDLIEELKKYNQELDILITTEDVIQYDNDGNMEADVINRNFYIMKIFEKNKKINIDVQE
ncbi:MAG: hypothetical protein ACLT40_01335 [Fusobacterium sp.]